MAKKNKAKALMKELKELMFREGTELSEKGFYQRAFSVLHSFGGSIDKNTTELSRIKEVIELLAKEI